MAAFSPSTGASSSSGTTTPWLDIKKNVGGAYDQVTQPIQGILDPYQRGITDSVMTRNATNDLLTAYGQGQRARIDQEFETTANNAAGGLAARGFGGSSLQLTEALGVERERQLARGSLEDSIIGQRLQNSQTYAQLIAQQTGQSGDAQVSLMRALLGLNNSTQSGSGAAPPVNYLPGGGGGASDRMNPNIPYGPITRPGDQIADGVTGGGQQAGGGGGGSGGGGSSGGGGGSVSITNPYGGDIGDGVTDGSEAGKNYDPVPPTGPVPLIPGDMGPRLTPDIYKENQKRQNQAEAEGRPVTYTYEGPVGG
jgi:hypothetical protein